MRRLTPNQPMVGVYPVRRKNPHCTDRNRRTRIGAAVAIFLLTSGLGLRQAIADGWTVEMVQQQGSCGQYISVAVDETTGTPHLCYIILDSDASLVYAVREGGVWVHEIVDAGGETGLWCDIAVDSNGEPHIAYKGEYPIGLLYAHKSAGSWTVEEVPSTNWAVAHISIALDSADNPHISYVDETAASIILASRYGTWTTQVVAATGANSTSLAIDPFDHPHISYTGNVWVRYAEKTGGSWNVETIESGSGLQHTALALDTQGNPHVAYRRTGGGIAKVHYAHKSGGDWVLEHDVFSSPLLENSVSLAVDAAGIPHLVEGRYPSYQLTHATKSGEVWTYENIDFAGGDYKDVAIDQSGVIHVGYFIYDTPEDAKYAFKTLPTVSTPETVDLLNTRLVMSEIWPNPQRGSEAKAWFDLTLVDGGTINLQLLDVSGRRIVGDPGTMTLVHGRSRVNWTPGRLAAGTYLLHARDSEGAVASRKWIITD